MTDHAGFQFPDSCLGASPNAPPPQTKKNHRSLGGRSGYGSSGAIPRPNLLSAKRAYHSAATFVFALEFPPPFDVSLHYIWFFSRCCTTDTALAMTSHDHIPGPASKRVGIHLRGISYPLVNIRHDSSATRNGLFDNTCPRSIALTISTG